MLIRFPDSEYAEPFRAYVNYFEDLAGVVGGLYGVGDSLVAGVHSGIAQHLGAGRVQKRNLDVMGRGLVDASFRKSWSMLRRLDLELEDADVFDEEANAWLPAQAYYAVFHAVLGFAAASGQTLPRGHAGTLKLVGKEVTRGALPRPWDAWCSGCPQTGTAKFGGVVPHGDPVHPLSSPHPSTSEDRIAMFLRTTRSKELDRRFREQRKRNVYPGRSRRNLSRQKKEQLADKMAPTTLFDVFWRIRKKVHYEEADTFVLGAGGPVDARTFGQALTTVTDATVAALEGLTAAYVGPDLLSDISTAHQYRTSSGPRSAVGLRAKSWQCRRRGSGQQ